MRITRFVALVAISAVVFAACGDDDDGTKASSGSSKGETVTVQVDNKADKLNFESISYFPKELSLTPGSTVRFHMNFQGEPHTVTFGSSIDTALKKYDTLTPEQQQGPPPPEIQALKIPFVIPDDADFSDIANVKFNQSAAQPCFLKAGETAPGAAPCTTQKATVPFDATQPFYNSGLLKDDQTFTFRLADDIKAGTYQWVCLFHGPEMRGKLTVVSSGASSQDASAVRAAGNKQLGEDVAKLTPEAAKATTGAKPGEVKAGVEVEGVNSGVISFFPKDVSIPVGGAVTWNLSFHTVSFNPPEDARPDVTQASDGSWSFNPKSFTAVGYTPPPPPQGDGGGGPPDPNAPPPPPTNVDGGTWDGSGFYSSGSVNAEGDVLFKLTFSKAGTYKYTCLIHPDMEGLVKVG